MLNKYFIEDTILEQVQRGFSIPIRVSIVTINEDIKPSQTFLNYTKEKGYFLYNKNIGEIYNCKENIIENFIEGIYNLGYTIATDKLGNEIKKGDTILIDNKYIAKVNKVILEPMELLKENGYDDYKSYIKYQYILKPVIKYTILMSEYSNPYTHNLEFKEVTGKKKETMYGTSHVVVLK